MVYHFSSGLNIKILVFFFSADNWAGMKTMILFKTDVGQEGFKRLNIILY